MNETFLENILNEISVSGCEEPVQEVVTCRRDRRGDFQCGRKRAASGCKPRRDHPLYISGAADQDTREEGDRLRSCRSKTGNL